MTAAARYARVLRAPEVGRLLASAVLARMPIGLDGLAIVLFVQDQKGSFGPAGAVAGAFGVALAVTTPLQGRLIDRHGHARVLLPLAAGHAVALALLVVLGLAGAPTVALAACGAIAGATLPPVGAVVRPLLPELLDGRPELLPTAFALDSVLIELSFVVGPLLAAVLVSLVAPAAALLAACLLVLVGTATLVGAPASRAWVPSAPAARHPLGPLAAPGVRTIVAATLPIGFCLGVTEVALPAFATDQGHRPAAGVLLAFWSLGSGLGGLAYGARGHHGPLGRTYVRLALLLPLTIVPLLAASSVAVMLPLAIVAGAGIAPLFAAGNQLVGEVAPRGVVTEAFTWPVTAIALGVASGNAVSGLVVDGAGWREAVVVGVAVSLVGAAIAVRWRGTLQAAPAAAGVPA